MSRWLNVRNLVPAMTVVAIASAVLLTVELASGDPTPPPRPPDLDVTPAPRHIDVIPEPPPLPEDGGASPPPIKVAGVEVPYPPGASFSVVQGGYVGDGGPTLGFHRGNSFVLFNENGMLESSVAPEDNADFQPTLDTLEQVAASETH